MKTRSKSAPARLSGATLAACAAVVACLCRPLAVRADAPQSTLPAAGENAAANDAASNRPPTNPALEKFGAAVTFYASFDNGAAADLSNGDGTPREPKMEIELKKGVFGQAFLAGEKGITFSAENNLDLSKPGSLIVWLSAYEWKRGDEVSYIFFVNAPTQNRSLMLARMGDKRNKEAIYAYTAAGKDKGSIIAGNSASWKDGQWHLMAVNWRSDSVEFSLDGNELQRQGSPEFGKVEGAPGWIFVGGKGDPNQKYLVDELMVLNRPLEIDEIRELWKAAPAAPNDAH